MNKLQWSFIALTLLIISIFDMMIPDPLFLVDEIALWSATYYAFKKVIS